MLDKISEYIKLIPRVVNNADKIVKGIINDVKFNNNNLPEEEQEEIIRRRLICVDCPYNSTNAPSSPEYYKLYNGQRYKPEARYDLHCAICACNIHWKTVVMDEKCGLSYYNDLNPNRKQELKWEPFKKTKDVQQTTIQQFREEGTTSEGTDSIQSGSDT